MPASRFDRPVPTVLFVCVHNAGRSQMAAAFARELGGDRVRVLSAGTMPADEVHPAVVEAMREVGVDLGAARPEALTDGMVETADAVVTMGCGDACPVYPGRRYLDWALEDPAALDLDGVRRVRDAIRERVAALLEELGVATA